MKKLALALVFSVSSINAADSWDSAKIQTAPDGASVSISMHDISPLKVHNDVFAVFTLLLTDSCDSQPLLYILQKGTDDKSASTIVTVNQQPVKFTRVLIDDDFTMISSPQTKQGEMFFRQAFINSKEVTLEIDDKLYTITAKGFSSAITKLKTQCKVAKKALKDTL